MGYIVSTLRRPRALPEFPVVIAWVSPEDIVSLVDATETLEIKGLEACSVTIEQMTNVTTTPSVDESGGKETERTAEQYSHGYFYCIQTKRLDRCVNYTCCIHLIVLAPGLQVPRRMIGIVGPSAISPYVQVILVPETPLFPAELLQKVAISDNSQLSAIESLRYILTGADEFADWESDWGDLIIWWLLLLKPYWFLIAFSLVFFPLLVLVIVLVFVR
ncbi:hypothetical protein CBS147332_6316 [Penicillium roqueforti]|nr:hypothetical protein CBS147332_6316 [Penicillium roqueforti]KAI3098707.1 hypothetical protein CBS147331_8781 [Penicillium roqueforti]